MPFDIATHADRSTLILDQLVLEPLVIPRQVVMLRVLFHGRPQVTLA